MTARTINTHIDLTDDSTAVMDFAAALLRQTTKEEGVLLSPVSLLYALGMTANGASGETLKQIETAAGMSLTELNDYLYTFRMSLPANSKSARLSLADSLWLRDVFRAEDDFLRACVNYYGAEVYRSAFDATLPADVNAWVEKHTDGMIDAILPEDAPSELTMLYLINAAAFNAKWETAYEKGSVLSGTFHSADGAEQDAEFMWGEESIYLSGHGATGFLKPYAGGRYAFAALLPDEGTSLAELLSGLNGTKLYDLINQHHYSKVETALPKFTGSTELELIPALEAMGITDPKQQVVLDRPFLYMIVDTHACLPIFVGTVTTLAE